MTTSRLDKQVAPIYKGLRHPSVVYRSIKTLFRQNRESKEAVTSHLDDSAAIGRATGTRQQLEAPRPRTTIPTNSRADSI